MYQQQFHTANYRGNQPGHDQSLRGDSSQPSMMGTGGGQVVSQYRGMQRTFQPTGPVQSFYNQNPYAQQSQFVGPNAYQTSAYRGNQPGHDQYLRADSTQPSGYRGGVGVVQGMSQVQQGQTFVSPNSFHTANYRGNQPGHDQTLRADSMQPSGFGTVGTGMSQSAYQPAYTGTNAYQTSGYRGNQPGHDQYLRADSTQPSNFGVNAYQTQFTNQLQQNSF
jgi:hypothetical protein